MHPDNDKMMEKKPIIIYWENFSFFFLQSQNVMWSGTFPLK